MKRWLLIGLGVLVALLVLVDVGGRFAAEAATAKALTSSLDLSSQPKVTIHGVPFLAHLASGNFPSVTLEGQEVDSGEVTLKRVRTVLRDVHVPVMSLAQGHRVNITADSGSGTAVITAAEITRVLQNRGTGVTVEFKGGQVELQIPGIPAFVNATVGVESGQLVLRAAALQQLGVGLPDVIPGVRYTAVRLVGDEAVLGFTLENPSFAVGG